MPLKSNYVIRFYEICKDKFEEAIRYKKVKSVEYEIKIIELRELFEIPESYRYDVIKKNILDKSVEQFKEKTDIQISYKEMKLGRRVDRVLITISENDKGSNNYLSSRIAFITYMRENFINADILKAINQENKLPMIISIDPSGKLYDKKGIIFDAKRSDEIWDALFNLAKSNKLSILNNHLQMENKVEN